MNLIFPTVLFSLVSLAFPAIVINEVPATGAFDSRRANDTCPGDPDKTDPGVCGCGVPDTDTDMDGTPDCKDSCPNEPKKTDPGFCGCNSPDTDSDNDGIPDCADSCSQQGKPGRRLFRKLQHGPACK